MSKVWWNELEINAYILLPVEEHKRVATVDCLSLDLFTWDLHVDLSKGMELLEELYLGL